MSRCEGNYNLDNLELSPLESLAMPDKLPPMTIYANLMEEARYRIEAMDAALGGRLALLDMILEEFVYLQIRLLCEIVALGCLIAHGDFTQEQLTKLCNEYDADTIIKNLAALNPTFFPIPIRMTIRSPSPGDPGEVRLDDPPADSFLTKDELLSLYGRTGNYLHRGKLKQLASRPPYAAVDMSQVTIWAKKVLGLLDQHRIRSPDNLQHWLCALKGPDGKVMMAVAQSPRPT
jgi:hypothetical protein